MGRAASSPGPRTENVNIIAPYPEGRKERQVWNRIEKWKEDIISSDKF